MNRKNQVLDALSDTYEELNRLHQMIPEDTNPKFNVWLAIIMKIKNILSLCLILIMIGCDESSSPAAPAQTVFGCMDEAACNYDPNANENQGCEYASCSPCDDEYSYMMPNSISIIRPIS